MTSTARLSRTADRPGPAQKSPFRSSKAAPRIRGAHAMIAKREQEIAALEKALDAETDKKKQRVLTQRLQASVNNLNSWKRYAGDGSPREPRAVIIPTR